MYGFSIIDKSLRETERSGVVHVLDLPASIPICSLAYFFFLCVKECHCAFGVGRGGSPMAMQGSGRDKVIRTHLTDMTGKVTGGHCGPLRVDLPQIHPVIHINRHKHAHSK